MVRIKLGEKPYEFRDKVAFNVLTSHSYFNESSLLRYTFVWKESEEKAATITIHPGEIFEYDENNLSDWRVITNEEQDIHTEDWWV